MVKTLNSQYGNKKDLSKKRSLRQSAGMEEILPLGSPKET